MLDADYGQGERRAALDWGIGEPNWALTGLIKLTKQRPSVLAAQQESSSSYRCLVRWLVAMAQRHSLLGSSRPRQSAAGDREEEGVRGSEATPPVAGAAAPPRP